MRATRSSSLEFHEGIVPRLLAGNRHVRKVRRLRALLGLAARWSVRVGVLWAVVFLGGRGIRLATTSPALAIGTVEFSGVEHTSQASLEAIATALRGKNLLVADLQTVQRTWSNRGWIEALTLRRNPPSSVLVRIVERRPVAVLAARGGRFFVGADGVIIDSCPEGGLDSALPLVGVSEAHREGLGQALEFIRQASSRPDFLNRVRRIEALSSDEMAIDLHDTAYRLLVGRGAYVEKIDKYRLVEPLLAREADGTEVVNLAYRHQVVLSQAR